MNNRTFFLRGVTLLAFSTAAVAAATISCALVPGRLALTGAALVACGLLLLILPSVVASRRVPSIRRPHGLSPYPIASLLLAVSLAVFGLARMPASNALWYEELELRADVSIREECVREVASSSVSPAGTTFTFDFRINNIDSRECQGVSYIEAYVCFDKGDVTATTQPPGWKYTPRKEKNIKWEWSAGGDGPADGTYTFSFTVPGATTTTSVDLLWKAGPGTQVAGQITVPDCPLATGSSSLTKTSAGSVELTSGGTTAPEPVIVAPVPVYLGETCIAFKPRGAQWTEFTLVASRGLDNGVYQFTQDFAVTLANWTVSSFDWAATAGVEAVVVQTSSRYGNLYRYDPAPLAGAGLASPAPSQSLTTISICVESSVSGGTDQPGSTGKGSKPPSGGTTAPEIDAPDQPAPLPDQGTGTFYAYIGPGIR